ncbi:MAG: 4-amino-4-deoxychorismate lyase, partial [Caulobacteraceae bacterium]|nr:4-amino-4-deoxychorismate lyase [Caulobacteraceae bacterium]
MIELDDRGLTLGDGLFETLLAIDGRLQHAEVHLARLEAGCVELGLSAPGSGQAMTAMIQALSSARLDNGRAA